MIKKFESFSKNIYSPVRNIKIPEIDENTISIRSNKNELFYINIYFDNIGMVDYIENPWHISLPDWYGLSVSLIGVEQFIKKYNGVLYCGYLLDLEAKKYNI